MKAGDPPVPDVEAAEEVQHFPGPPRSCSLGITKDVRERALRLARDVFAGGLASAVSRGQSRTAPQPRPHQLDAVANLLEAVYLDGGATAPTNYLLQVVTFMITHSTGSGKSFTIAALAVALVGWGDCAGARIGMVLVLNDRLQLDRQLGSCVEAFWTGNGRPPASLRRASTTAELSGFLSAPWGAASRPQVVLTTVQKLATLWRAGGGRARAATVNSGAGQFRIAVIADEAHRHHGHGTTDQIHQILACTAGSTTGSGATKGIGSGGSGNNRRGTSGKLQPRQQPQGLTYFGFTATPSPKALQLFGICREVPADPWVSEDAGMADDGERDKGGAGSGEELPIDNTRNRSANLQRRTPLGHQAAGPGRVPPGIEQLLQGGGEGDGGSGAASTEVALLYTPFHAYTMRNAVQDGFVLDVLRSYTAVTPRLQIGGLRAGDSRSRGDRQNLTGPDPALNPGMDPDGTAGDEEIAEDVLVEAASNSREVVEHKAAYIVQRFVEMWRRASAGGFTSFRGMVVARSRQHVVWH
ncbi:hypothetical protein Vafri_6798 [Volvox africanus]|uniref:Helicase ATP-binding domain-containing protein n=1 Tax=Volvox africanus TaxID=51714 RepID=A0A8J4B381_9CHLO|nr:hypothetical protein Vafri_6798 [Volvox africanus]